MLIKINGDMTEIPEGSTISLQQGEHCLSYKGRKRNTKQYPEI